MFRKRLKGLLFSNLQYKLAAVLLSAIFWYIVQGEEILEINRRIAVQIIVPEGLAIKGSRTRYKDVSLRGPRVLLGAYPSRALDAYIKLAPGRVGQLRYRIDREQIDPNWDNRISLTVHDPYLTVYVDEAATKEVPIREVLAGSPSNGLMVEKTIFDPEKVVITGLKTDVQKIKEIQTEVIDVSGISQTKSVEVAFNKTGISDMQLSVEKIKAKIVVGEQKTNKVFSEVSLDVSGTHYQSNAKPSQVSIELQATPAVLATIKKSDLRAFIEASDLNLGRHEREIQVKIPPETTLIGVTPSKGIVELYNQRR